MDTLAAFARAEAARARGDDMKYYDYEKAKAIVEDGADTAMEAGLYMEGDRGWTHVTIWTKEDGWILNLDECPEIAGICGSIWATPMISVDDEEQECWTSKEPGRQKVKHRGKAHKAE